MGVRTHVGTYVRRYAAHTYVRIAAEQILRCVCLEKGAWLRAHVRVAGSGQRRRRSEKEKGPISYVRCAYVRTYLVESSDTYADVRAYIRTYVRVYVQNALRTFVIRTYSRGSRSAMREEPVNQGHALPVNATVRAVIWWFGCGYLLLRGALLFLHTIPCPRPSSESQPFLQMNLQFLRELRPCDPLKLRGCQ